MNTFTGANLSFKNRGIHFMLAEVVKFRKQLTVRDEFKQQSGWSNALNHYMISELENLADTLESITYNPEPVTQEELEARAANTSRSLAEDYNIYHVPSDNVVMPPALDRNVLWDLSGDNVDIPQPVEDKYPNDFARAFLTGLDNVFVQLTRLDSRHADITITKYESVMIRALLGELYTVTARKGGETNRSDIPTGTLPSDAESSFESTK